MWKKGDRVEVRNYPSSHWAGCGTLDRDNADYPVIVQFDDGRRGGFKHEYIFHLDEELDEENSDPKPIGYEWKVLPNIHTLKLQRQLQELDNNGFEVFEINGEGGYYTIIARRA